MGAIWGYFDETEEQALYTDCVRRTVNSTPSAALSEQTFRSASAGDRLDRTLYTDVHHYLPGALLPKADRTTMAHSLEAQSPFLDHEVAELAVRLRTSWRVRGRQTKWILRAVRGSGCQWRYAGAARWDLVRPCRWPRGPLHEPVQDLLLGQGTKLHDYLRPDSIVRLIDEN